jgi:AbrB family looped-hinge helix DNA binding protein
METTISPKYQIVIPKGVRKQLKLKGGQKLQVIVKGGVITLVPDRSLRELRGIFRGMDTTDVREEEERVDFS